MARFLLGLLGALLGVYLLCAGAYLAASAISPENPPGRDLIMGCAAPLCVMGGLIGGAWGASRLQWYAEGRPDTPHERRFRAYLFLNCVLSAVTLGYAMGQRGRELCAIPLDKRLIEKFRANPSPFERLRQMQRQDEKLRTWVKNGDSPGRYIEGELDWKRLAEYTEILQGLGLRGDLQTDERGGFILPAYSDEFPQSRADIKGYAYLPQSPTALVARMDGVSREKVLTGGRKSVALYRHIEGDWYVIYQYAARD